MEVHNTDREEDSVTYDMRKVYMEQLIGHIKVISDLDWQEAVWVKASLPNVVDSWEETMCMFFDDAMIDDFLTNIDPKFGLNQAQIDQLWKFRNILRIYSHKMYDYFEKTNQGYSDPRIIIADPEWHKVSKCAAETMKYFENYEVPLENNRDQA